MGRPKPWRIKSSVTLKDHRIFSLRKDVSVSPRTGREHEFVVLESLDWVSVVALDSEDRLIMVRQYRHGLGEVTLEVPGGLVDPGLTPEEAARTELRQETGYAARELIDLGDLSAAPAIFTNRLHVFLARDAYRVGELDQDEGEDIQVVLVPLDEVRSLIGSGELIHAQMIASIYLYELWREAEGAVSAPGGT
jgi:ADP-ribose pyrophosphatase